MAIKIEDQNIERELTAEERKAKGGMFFANIQRSGSQVNANVVDVCKVPSPGGPVPVPYPTVNEDPTVDPTKPNNTNPSLFARRTLLSSD